MVSRAVARKLLGAAGGWPSVGVKVGVGGIGVGVGGFGVAVAVGGSGVGVAVGTWFVLEVGVAVGATGVFADSPPGFPFTKIMGKRMLDRSINTEPDMVVPATSCPWVSPKEGAGCGEKLTTASLGVGGLRVFSSTVNKTPSVSARGGEAKLEMVKSSSPSVSF